MPPSLPVFLPAHVWELLLVVNQCDNSQSKLQIFKLTSLSLFPNQLMEFVHMPKELNDLSDWVLSHWFPTGKRSHAGAGRKTGQCKRCGRDGAQLNEDVISSGC